MGTEPPKKKTRAAEGAPSCIAQKAVSGSVIKTGDEGIAIGNGGIAVGPLKVEKGAGGVFIGDHVKEVFIPEEPPRLLSQDQAFQRIDAAVRSNLSQLELNKEKAANESNDFFWSNILFASLGFLVMLTGVGLLLANLIAAGIVVTAIAVIPFVTAALFLRKDKELRVTIERHHQHGGDCRCGRFLFSDLAMSLRFCRRFCLGTGRDMGPADQGSLRRGCYL